MLDVFRLATTGCQKLSLRSQNPDEDDIKLPETQFIKEQVTVSGLHPITIEAVGLVTNLDNTGGEPHPSLYRTMLMNDMKKRGIANPNGVELPTPARDAGPDFAVRRPPGHRCRRPTSTSKSCFLKTTEAIEPKGGWLMEAHLFGTGRRVGRPDPPGHSRPRGPIMLSTGVTATANRRSSVLEAREGILGRRKVPVDLLKKGRTLGLYCPQRFAVR